MRQSGLPVLGNGNTDQISGSGVGASEERGRGGGGKLRAVCVFSALDRRAALHGSCALCLCVCPAQQVARASRSEWRLRWRRGAQGQENGGPRWLLRHERRWSRQRGGRRAFVIRERGGCSRLQRDTEKRIGGKMGRSGERIEGQEAAVWSVEKETEKLSI